MDADPPRPVASPLPLDAPGARSRLTGAEARRAWFALVAVLCLAVVPDLIYALIAYAGPPVERWWTPSDSWAYVARSVSIVVPFAVLFRMAGHHLGEFGWVPLRLEPAFLWGLALAASALGLDWALVRAFGWDQTTVHTSTLAPREDPLEIGLFVGAIVLSAFAEEVIARGYLVTTLERLTGRGWLAVMVAAALFTSYHVYQGVHAVASIFVFGLLLGWAYRVFPSLWPVTVAHVAYNLWADYGHPAAL